ncbi:MAG: hypothetical protein AAF224_04185 [Pseudomonadota bacterium]
MAEKQKPDMTGASQDETRRPDTDREARKADDTNLFERNDRDSDADDDDRRGGEGFVFADDLDEADAATSQEAFSGDHGDADAEAPRRERDAPHARPGDSEAEADDRDARAGFDEPEDLRDFVMSQLGGAVDGERSVFVRNMLVATASVPFVFLLVLILATFVFGDPEEGGAVGVQAQRAAAEAAYRQQAVERVAQAPVAEDGSPVLASAQLEGFKIAVPVDGVAQSVGLDGERLAILVDGEDGQTVVIYHVAKGAVLATLPIGFGETITTANTNKAVATARRSQPSSVRRERESARASSEASRASRTSRNAVSEPVADRSNAVDEVEAAGSGSFPGTPTLKATVAPRSVAAAGQNAPSTGSEIAASVASPVASIDAGSIADASEPVTPAAPVADDPILNALNP